MLKTKASHKIVAEEDMNNMKRLNYGDYYLQPSNFNDKVRKLESSV